MLSAQSLQTLRGAKAVNACSRGRASGALSLACSRIHVLARESWCQKLATRAAEQPQLLAWQHAAFKRTA